MELIEITQRLNTQEKCIKYLEHLRWQGTPICVYCNSDKVSSMVKERRHHCNNCNKSFSVKVGTIFESSNLALPKWFIAISLILNAKKGISSLQLSRDIKVNKDTAWYMQKRIREAMQGGGRKLLKGIVEVDETYLGGNVKNKHKHVREYLHKEKMVGTGGGQRVPVFGLIERKGEVNVQVVTHADGIHLKPIIRDKVDRGAIIVSDGFGAYSGLNKEYKGHEIINHEKDEFVRGQFHTNNIEGFWSLVKRSIVGQYHQITKRHLQSYLNEFSFKYNHKNTKNFFELFLSNALTVSKNNTVPT